MCGNRRHLDVDTLRPSKRARCLGLLDDPFAPYTPAIERMVRENPERGRKVLAQLRAATQSQAPSNNGGSK